MPIIQMSSDEEKNLTIRYDYYDTIHGNCLIAATDKGIAFIGLGDAEHLYDELKKTYKAASLVKQAGPLHTQALSHITDPASPIDIPFHIKGTDFQVKVWNALLTIPTGKTSSYKYIAEKIGMPKATRAVGTAIGHNPVSCLIPCHRVIRSDGKLGGYYWGIGIKEKILRYESSN